MDNFKNSFSSIICACEIYVKIHQHKLLTYPIEWNSNTKRLIANNSLEKLKFHIVITLLTTLFGISWCGSILFNIFSHYKNIKGIFFFLFLALRYIFILFLYGLLCVLAIIEFYISVDVCGAANELLRLSENFEKCK